MAIASFDKYFLNLPPLDRQKDFHAFWKKGIDSVRKVPLDAVTKKSSRKSWGRFAVYDISFQGFMKTRIFGTLHVPKGVKKPRVIIHVHDYNRLGEINRNILNDSAAYYFMTLRGHDSLLELPAEEQTTPGFMIENIMDPETYYVKAVYLDTIRAIDMLRLVPEINCSDIGVMGKGFGAAAALFTAAYSDRVRGLVLDSPAFCNLVLGQNLAVSDLANEINEFVSAVKAKKKDVKTNLTYFDAINFSDMVRCPVLATMGLRDSESPPECVMACFNHILSEKYIEVYPEQGHEAGGEAQFIKSINWLVNQINR